MLGTTSSLSNVTPPKQDKQVSLGQPCPLQGSSWSCLDVQSIAAASCRKLCWAGLSEQRSDRVSIATS